MKALVSLASLLAIVLIGLVVETPANGRRAVVALQNSPATDDASFEVTGLVETPGRLSVADLRALPGETIAATVDVAGTAQPLTYTGVRLWDVLARANPIVDPARNGDPLRTYVVLTARDGAEVVVALGEIHPAFGGQPYLLAWAENGAALTGARGPVELVVPGDRTGGRDIRGIRTIEVRGVDSPPRG